MKRFVPLLLPLALVACSSSTPSDPPTSTASTAHVATVADAASTARANDMTAETSKPVSNLDVLSRYHWQLVSAKDQSGQRIDAFFVNADKPLQLDFRDGRISVSHTCNAMSGSYKVADGTMHIEPMIHTMMACADDKLMAMEKAATHFLQGDLDVTLTKTDTSQPELTLVGAKGDTLVFAGHATAQTGDGNKGTTVPR